MTDSPITSSKPMKEQELRNHLTCSFCGKAITHSGLPLFWRVKVERFGIDAQAVRRQQGLGMMLGSGSLAMVMGPDEDLALPVMKPTTLTACEPCAMKPVVLAIALEKQQ